jgi:septal ring factor EnvC (AmiA/AmiB activator)
MMCGANKRFFLYLLLVFLFASVAGVLRAGEPEPLYLISETELQIIEEYKRNSEAEKQTWRLQVQELKTQAAGLWKESESLNDQLQNQREQNRMLQRSFNESEEENLMEISMKNGEIAELKQEAATYKGSAQSRLGIIAALLSPWIFFIVFKIYRFFKIV